MRSDYSADDATDRGILLVGYGVALCIGIAFGLVGGLVIGRWGL